MISPRKHTQTEISIFRRGQPCYYVIPGEWSKCRVSQADGRRYLRERADVITCIAVKYDSMESLYRVNTDNHRFTACEIDDRPSPRSRLCVFNGTLL